MRVARLAVCAVLVAPVPIAFVNSLRRETEPITLPPLLGGMLQREAMPHAHTLGLVSHSTVTPKHRAHRVQVTRHVARPQRATPILVTYVVPPARHATPSVTTRHVVRPTNHTHTVVPRTTTPTPKPRPKPTPRPKPAPKPTPPATTPPTSAPPTTEPPTTPGGGGSTPAGTPTSPAPTAPATPSSPGPPSSPSTPTTPSAPSTPSTPTTPASPGTPATPSDPGVAPAQETRPGNGYGDQNHAHTGPPGKNKP